MRGMSSALCICGQDMSNSVALTSLPAFGQQSLHNDGFLQVYLLHFFLGSVHHSSLQDMQSCSTESSFPFFPGCAQELLTAVALLWTRLAGSGDAVQAVCGTPTGA